MSAQFLPQGDVTLLYLANERTLFRCCLYDFVTAGIPLTILRSYSHSLATAGIWHYVASPCRNSGAAVGGFKTIIHYIDNQFERYLHDESGLNRRHIIDNRVHCCFYFISPFGHGLKPLDVEFMKALHGKVNIVPVIAKADTLTLKERERLKRRRCRHSWSRGGHMVVMTPNQRWRHCPPPSVKSNIKRKSGLRLLSIFFFDIQFVQRQGQRH
ncbi:unnamed protein product [Ranitomeya imitator]|uniref:Septin-type G domain-containing protein n=1 Tax=Ranitomeya imitator TaxID=111125 RepID=A0ABN9KMM0_9NEOB|nr:unnamed protein product [Ranitomeya imitator]